MNATRYPDASLFLRFWLAILFLYGGSVTAGPPEMRESFPLLSDGEPLVAPLQIEGKKFLFLVDTGTDTTIFDVAVPAGARVGSLNAMSPGGKHKIGLFRCPSATLGGSPFVVDEVGKMDLSPLRERIGLPIMGIIGMDFLRAYILYIDPDSGCFSILKGPVKYRADVMPMTYTGVRTLTPQIEVALGNATIPLRVDTGLTGSTSLGLTEDTLRSLSRGPTIRQEGTGHALGGIDEREIKYYRLTSMRIGNHVVENTLCMTMPNANYLSLGALTRFVVAFDFPDRKVYLRKGRDFKRVDRRIDLGLSLKSRDGITWVSEMEKGGVASDADFRIGDEIVTVDGEPMRSRTTMEVTRSLDRGRGKRCEVRRDGVLQVIRLPEPKPGSR